MPDYYFGDYWPSGVCDDGTQVPVPLGEQCFLCNEMIQVFDQGSFTHVLQGDEERGWESVMLPVHRECSLREVMGGIGHLEDHDHWCSEIHDPDGGRTRRQSSLQVWDWINRHGYPVA